MQAMHFTASFIAVLFFICAASFEDVMASNKKRVRERTLQSFFNYGCNATIYKECGEPDHQPLDNYANLLYTKATAQMDSGDELHYVWSTVGGPALLVARSAAPGADLRIDWAQFLQTNASHSWGAVWFANLSDPFIYGVFFTRLIEYNDKHDSSDISKLNQSDTSLFHEYDLSTWRWQSAQSESIDDQKLAFTANMPQLMQQNGSVTFTVGISAKDGSRGSELPFLDLTENTTHLDLEINNFKPHFSKSRFALELAMVTKGNPSREAKIDKRKSIDDEYSPGVFTVKTVESDHGASLKNAYLQWKPVCYYDPKRALEVSTKTREYGLRPFSSQAKQRNLVYAFFGPALNNATVHDLGAHMLNISFGLTKDKFYNRENFTAWSMTVGYGSPPTDHISAVILILISAGLGLPVILILFGGVGVCIKRRKKRQEGDSAYTGIN